MATETEQLVVSLEARIRDFEKNFQKANRTANDNFSAIEKRGKQSAEKLEKSFAESAVGVAKSLEGMFKGFMSGGIVAAGVGAAATAIGEVAKTIAEVDREARKAGVSAQVWQKWAYVATASGASIDGLTDAMKELNIRGDEFAKTGKGSAEEAFQRLGYSATDVAQKLRDPSRFMDEIIGKLQKLDAAAQTRILDEVFGGTGAEQMAKVLGLSVNQIQRLRAEAATFTEEQIASAKRIDAEFETLWRNVSVYAKGALINGIGYAEQLIDVLGKIQGQPLIQRYNPDGDPKAKLEELEKRRNAVQNQIDAVKANPGPFSQFEVKQLEQTLRAIEEQMADLGGGSDQLKGALAELSTITQNVGKGFDSSAASAANFQSALTALKQMVPGLKADLDTLANVNSIDATYQKAVQNARTMGEVLNATDIANRAKTAARFGSHSNILDLIASVESGGDYNATLDNGRWTGGAQNLKAMTLDQVRALQRQMLANPANRALYGDGKGSSALGRYQITGATLQGLIEEMGLSGDRLFDQATQDELARTLLRRRGNDPASLRKEWTGLNRVDDSTIRNTFDATPMGAQKLDPSPGQQRALELTKQQDEARKNLNRTITESLSLAQFEASISGMSAQQQQIELGVYRAKQEAQRAGITLSDQELNSIREKITATEQLSTATKQTAQSAKAAGDAQKFFAENFTSALSGLLTGATTLEGAIQQLANSLINAALQALLLGQGPLAKMAGTSPAAGSASGLGGIFGALFSANGGPVSRDRMRVLHLAGGGNVRGPGTSRSDSIPAMLSNGEYVVNAAATAKNRQILEAINSGRTPKLAGAGKVAGTNVVNTISNNFAPAVNISVQASGNKETDDAMVARLSKELDTQLENKMVEFAQRQQRPGNMLNRRGF